MLKLNKDVVKDLFPNINKKRFELETEMKTIWRSDKCH